MNFKIQEKLARHWWLTPVILVIRRQRSEGSWFEASPGKLFTRPYLIPITKRDGKVAQGEGPEFKP
jgi:hypothetical protein